MVDSSAVLAVLFGEPHGAWAAERLADPTVEPLMCTVNLAEVLIRLEDRQPARFRELEAALLATNVRFSPPGADRARAAARARVRWPLNLGDCFVYALAAAEEAPILTLDRDFGACDRPLVAPWCAG